MSAPRKSLPFAAWPAADRAEWERAFLEGDVFDGRGPGAHLAPRSRLTIERGYARWLAFVAQHDAASMQLDPASRVTPAVLRAFIDTQSARCSPTTVWNDVKSVYDAMRLLAPDQDWTWLRTVKARLERRLPPRRAGPVVDSGRLLDLGLRLMDEAIGKAVLGERPALVAYRDGLIIAFLALRPLRRRTLACLRIGRQLQQIGDTWVLVLEPEDLKNREPAEFSFPAILVSYLERYLRDFRPKMLGADRHDGLWASPNGSAMKEGAIYAAVHMRTQRAFGRPVNLHAFRHSAATTTAIHAPEQVGITRDLLTHKDIRTTKRYYDMAGSLAAGRVHALQISKLRDRLRRPRPCPGR